MSYISRARESSSAARAASSSCASCALQPRPEDGSEWQWSGINFGRIAHHRSNTTSPVQLQHASHSRPRNICGEPIRQAMHSHGFHQLTPLLLRNATIDRCGRTSTACSMTPTKRKQTCWQSNGKVFENVRLQLEGLLTRPKEVHHKDRCAQPTP